MASSIVPLKSGFPIRPMDRAVAKARKAVNLMKVEQAAEAAVLMDRIDNGYQMAEYTTLRMAGLDTVAQAAEITNPRIGPYLQQMEAMLAIGSALIIQRYMGDR